MKLTMSGAEVKSVILKAISAKVGYKFDPQTTAINIQMPEDHESGFVNFDEVIGAAVIDFGEDV